MQKTARIWSRPMTVLSGGMHPGKDVPPWSDQFKGSPFYAEAKSFDKDKACIDVEHAQQRIKDAEERVDDAKFSAKIASIEKRLVDWTHNQDGKEKQALAEKLAECRYRSFSEWSDFFKGSPFYKEAMKIEAEDAQREVGRRQRGLESQKGWLKDEENRVKQAEIEAKYAVWRLEQMGFSKTASLHLAAHQHTSESTMITEIMAEAFFHEMDAIEKSAAAGMVSRKAALGIGGAATAAAGAAGIAGGHHKGRKTGRREGYHVGSRHGFQVGARKGFTAGQVAMIRRLRAAQMARAKAQAVAKGKSKK